MKLLSVLIFFVSFTVNAADWRGVYEGVELYKDKEVQGLSYQFLDLRKSIGFYLYDADIADDEKGLECKIQTDAIVWTTSFAKVKLEECGVEEMNFELVLLLDYAIRGETGYPLKSDVNASLITHSNGASTETVTMWLERTDDKSLLHQLKQSVSYE